MNTNTLNFNNVQHIHPKYKSVHVQENVKVSEIRDAMNKLRYKIALTSYDFDEDEYGIIYEITVVNYFSGPEPLIILTIPDPDERYLDPPTYEPLTDYNKALQIYTEQVKHYTSLVRAETRDMQDIDIFKDKIEYVETCPKCCATCKYFKEHYKYDEFDKYRIDHHDHIKIDKLRYECVNPRNQEEFEYDIDPAFDPMHPPYHYSRTERHMIPLHPRVSLFGVCKNYELNN